GVAERDAAGVELLQAGDEAQQRALAAAALAHDRDELAGGDVQVDAAQHFIVAVGFAQAADAERQAAVMHLAFLTLLAQHTGLRREIGAAGELGFRKGGTKGCLHVIPSISAQRFWKAGCQESVRRSSTREALSASLPS